MQRRIGDRLLDDLHGGDWPGHLRSGGRDGRRLLGMVGEPLARLGLPGG